MITTKQRSNLKKIAHPLSATCQIGKNGVTENVILQIAENLFNKELVKIKILQNSPVTAKEIINDVAEKLSAEPVSAIGNVITLYKLSDKNDIDHIVL